MAKFLLNSIYFKARWEKDPYAPPGEFPLKKLSDDCLIMVIKDDETNTSELKIVERPTIEFYTIKDESLAKPFNEICVDKHLVDTHEVEYSKRDIEMCKYLGIEQEYRELKNNINNCYQNGTNYYDALNDLNEFMNEKVYKNPYIYGADVSIEDFYKTKFMLEHGDTIPKILNVSFYDIETYIYHYKTKVDQDNPIAPINVATYFNTKKRVLHAICLLMDEIPMQKEIQADIDGYVREYIAEDLTEDPDIKVQITFVDTEVMLLRTLFQLFKEDRPDFAMAWNNNYDNKYIIGRQKKLGMDVVDEWTHPDVPSEYRQFIFNEDRQRKKGFMGKKRPFHRLWDWIDTASYTTFIDQMSLYSNLRKRFQEETYKLDAITEKELGIKKVDLSQYGLNIRNAPFRNFKIFLKYALRDTYLLYKMEEKLKDLETYLMLCDNTHVENGINVSYVIKNAFYMIFCKDNKVIGNTIDYGVNESIDGALVQDPELVQVLPVIVGGKRTKIFKDIVDFDGKSLYPSLIIQHKIGKENQKFRIVSITDPNGKLKMSGQEFNQGLQTIDTSVFDMCNTLYGLPNLNQMVEVVEKQLQEMVK